MGDKRKRFLCALPFPNILCLVIFCPTGFEPAIFRLLVLTSRFIKGNKDYRIDPSRKKVLRLLVQVRHRPGTICPWSPGPSGCRRTWPPACRSSAPPAHAEVPTCVLPTLTYRTEIKRYKSVVRDVLSQLVFLVFST